MEQSIIGKVLTGMGQIPIERGKGDVNAMQKAIDGLRSGIVIGIFPEGTRSLGRELRPRSASGASPRPCPKPRWCAARWPAAPR